MAKTFLILVVCLLIPWRSSLAQETVAREPEKKLSPEATAEVKKLIESYGRSGNFLLPKNHSDAELVPNLTPSNSLLYAQIKELQNTVTRLTSELNLLKKENTNLLEQRDRLIALLTEKTDAKRNP
jgi:dynactin complex subunit